MEAKIALLLWVADMDSELWREEAACRGMDTGVFFGGEEVSRQERWSASEAKRVCAGCRVRGECLEFALRTSQPLGIWGGKTPRERRAMQRAKQQPAAPAEGSGKSKQLRARLAQ